MRPLTPWLIWFNELAGETPSFLCISVHSIQEMRASAFCRDCIATDPRQLVFACWIYPPLCLSCPRHCIFDLPWQAALQVRIVLLGEGTKERKGKERNDSHDSFLAPGSNSCEGRGWHRPHSRHGAPVPEHGPEHGPGVGGRSEPFGADSRVSRVRPSERSRRRRGKGAAVRVGYGRQGLRGGAIRRYACFRGPRTIQGPSPGLPLCAPKGDSAAPLHVSGLCVPAQGLQRKSDSRSRKPISMLRVKPATTACNLLFWCLLYASSRRAREHALIFNSLNR